VSSKPTWRAQFDRMHRSVAQLQKAYEHVPAGDRGEAEDALYHFWCDAFHLRDWIQNSPVADEVKQDVRNLFRDRADSQEPPSTDSRNLNTKGEIFNRRKGVNFRPPLTSATIAAEAKTARPGERPNTQPRKEDLPQQRL
jgi:hypothetical protein